VTVKIIESLEINARLSETMRV